MSFKKLIIAIDASTSVDGGSMTHLIEVFRNIPANIFFFIEKIIIFGNDEILSKIENKSYIIKYSNKFLNSNFIIKKLWVNLFLKKTLLTYNCDILLDLSGTYIGWFTPYIGMSQNMLIYETEEVNRFNSIYQKIRFFILRKMQIYSFNNSEGVIFISNYAKNIVLNYLKPNLNWTIIHHGISKIFLQNSKHEYDAELFNDKIIFRLLYVSNFLPYKHHINVINAVLELNCPEIPLELLLVGGNSETKFGCKILDYIDEKGKNCINHLEKVSYDEIHKVYNSADVFIYASTCENMPNTLIEAMASGIPVICSNYGPMPEFGKDAVIYFNPLDVNSLKVAILKLYGDKNLRKKMIENNKNYISSFSWEKCSSELFQFLKFCKLKSKN